MASYEQPNYLKNNQFVPIFNSTNFSEPNSQSTGTSVNVSDLDTRYLSKLGNDTTPYNLTVLGNVSCNNISFNTSGYYQSIYSDDTNILYSTTSLTNYMNVSLTLPAGTYLITYSTSIRVYNSNYIAYVLLSTLSNTNTDVDILNASIPNTTTVAKTVTSGVGTIPIIVSNSIVKTFDAQTSIYLYTALGTLASLPAGQILFTNSYNLNIAQPDASVILNAIKIR